jgi:hypothetical protein
VYAVALGTGYSTVSVANVSATGTGSVAIVAGAPTGGAVNVTVAQGATVTGNAIGVYAISPTSITLNNNGTITTSGTSGGTYAVVTALAPTSSPITINNSSTGVIDGAVKLGGTDNIFNNAGTWNISGASTLGTGGSPVVNNTGFVVVSGPSSSITGLSAWNNAGGSVDISTGNSLDISPAVFNGGAGSQLRVNANGPDGILTVGSSTSTTAVIPVDILAGAKPAMDFTGIPIVVGASPGTFTLGGASDFHAGFVDYRLVFTPANSQTNTPSVYTIFGLPGPEVFEALNIPYALEQFWRNSTNAFDARTREIRDQQITNGQPTRTGWEFWAQPFGGHDKFDRFHLETFPLVDQNNPPFVFRQVGTHNSNFGLQVGGDWLGKWGTGYGYWGFTGGLQSQQTFFTDGNQNDLYSLGGNIGVYGGGTWMGFYFDGIGKADFVDMNMNFNSANFSPTHTFEVWGTRGEIGYRWPFMGFFVEPAARVSAEWTSLENLHPFGALLHFDDNNGPVVIGDVGGRVGTTFNILGVTYSGYAGAFWTDQWDGQTRMTFTTLGGAPGTVGPTTILLTQPTTGSAIKVEYGAETGSWYYGMKGFFEGANIVEGDGFGAWSARMGVRWTF